MIADMPSLVGEAVQDVFDTMLDCGVEPDDSAIREDEPRLSASVGFIGRLTGVVHFHTSCRFASQVAARLLGGEAAQQDHLVRDALGELATIVAGQVKSRLGDRGAACILTAPSVAPGLSITTVPARGAEQALMAFRCEDSQLVVEALFKSIKEN